MTNRKIDLGADAQVRVQEPVKGVTYDSFGGVFDRDDAVVGLSLLHLAENSGDALSGDQLDAVAKPAERRHVGVAAGRAPVADRQRSLEGAAGRNDLEVDRA